MMVRSFALMLLVFLSFGLAAQPVDFSTPIGRVKYTIDQVSRILKDDLLEGDARRNRISALIYEGFDFRSISQSVISTRWQRATEEERRKFTEFFSRYIEATCCDGAGVYPDQQVIYMDEIVRGDLSIVKTIITAGGTKIPVDYRLKKNQGSWYAYDIVIDGVSLVASYRSTFAAIVKNEGMDGLVSDVQRRIDKYRQENANEAG